jgi:hypothetical protein
VKLILHQIALTTLCFGLLYGAVLGFTFLVFPDPPRVGWLDLETSDTTPYRTATKNFFLARDVLDVPDQKVLLIGASNTLVGFTQRSVQALVPCAKVSNLAIGSANITELHQLVDLVHEVQDEGARRSNTFVIGVWFGMFADTEKRWPGPDRHHGDTDLDVERYRYGFYRRTSTGPVATLPPEWLRAGALLIRPYLLVEEVTRDLTVEFRRIVLGRQPNLTEAQRETAVMSEQDKSDALAYWRLNMGSTSEISQAQVLLLQNTIDELLRSGEKVVLVDLPIPSWHRDASIYQPGYARAVENIFNHFAGRPNFQGLKMADLDEDKDYVDEVHPKPHLANVWASRLASVLTPLTCTARTATDPEAPCRSGLQLPPTDTDAAKLSAGERALPKTRNAHDGRSTNIRQADGRVPRCVR